MNPIAIRLLNQQLILPQFSQPAQVVSHFGAMQAQDYRMIRWAVAMRTQIPAEAAFRRDFDSGAILRIHLLRSTWQLVAAQDYRWMLDLCAKKSFATLHGWMKSNNITISDQEQKEIGRILEQTAADKADSTKEDFAQALAQKGIHMDDHRLSYHIRMAELNGLLVSGNLHKSKATYCLTSQKVKPAPALARDEALALFAQKYFQSHAPATLEDFVWWSGLNTNDCKKGMQLLGSCLHQETWKGRDFYLLDGCRTQGFRKGCSLLLSPYDEYLIGYKSRDVVLAPEKAHYAHSNNGIFHPVIAHDGHIVGNWSPSKKQLTFALFDSGAAVNLESHWAVYQQYN